jgi:hypothetical protein
MTLEEALEHWRRERERLAGIQEWVDAGKPPPPPSLQPSLQRYGRLNKTDAKRALKELREELAKDAFLRMFSAFEGQLRAAFSGWLGKKCQTTTSPEDINEELPAIEGVLRIAAALEPRFDPSRSGYLNNVRETRNKLVHGGFASPIPYDLETLHGKLAEVLALFT